MKQHTVLIIDDNREFGFILTKKISLVDNKVHTLFMDDAAEALEYLGNVPKDLFPHMIFLDLHMPGISGLKFLEHFEKILMKTGAKTKVVILTSSTSERVKQSVSHYDFILDYLYKPVDIEKVMPLIKGVTSSIGK